MAANETIIKYIHICPKNYTCHDEITSTLILPIFNESGISNGLRLFLYLVALLWCFTGVAIGADLFMCAIETITSKTKKIQVALAGDDVNMTEEIEIQVWNGTVANLTLMALGSSAPEILLSVIEIIGNKFESGALGPGTIVGSAAFNLLVIIGVSIMCIPDGENRRVKAFPVFLITSFFAVFAYIWIWIVMVGVSPNIIEVWEAVLTLLYFPILVVLAYIADKQFFGLCGGKDKTDDETELYNLNLLDEEVLKQHHPDFIDYMKEIASNPKITDEEAAKLIAMRIHRSKRQSYGRYRVGALRNVMGGRKIDPVLSDNLKAIVNAESGKFVDEEVELGEPPKSVVEFHVTAINVLESGKVVNVEVNRKHHLEKTVRVHYETIDGSANADEDYKPKKDVLIFEPNEDKKTIDIEIIDDYIWEPNETFFIKLWVEKPDQEHCQIGHHNIAEVTIINDDDPGTFQFKKPSNIVKESCGQAIIEIERNDGADGVVEVSYITKDQKAVHGKDYIGSPEGAVVVFDHGEVVKEIMIDIIDDHSFEKDETFIIEISELNCEGAKIGSLKRTVITIMNDDEYKKTFDRVVGLANFNQHLFDLGAESWGQQFTEAMNVNGGDTENACAFDYVMHFITFAWKVIFACVPPCSWAGGWLAFVILIAMIGLLTAIIGDLATVFGCLCDLKPEVTAITFVALGTSLPDLFASKAAAVNEKYADASIGNVTGSNGVNVFLGLGIPWVIATIYHEANGTTFKTKEGALTSSVVTYCACAIVCILLMIVRRNVKALGNGELGGPKTPKMVCGAFLICLWFLYVLISANVAYGNIPAI